MCLSFLYVLPSTKKAAPNLGTASLVVSSLSSDLFADFKHLLAVQITAILAGHTAKHLGVTLGAFNKIRHDKLPVALVASCPGLGPFTLGMCHISSPPYIIISLLFIKILPSKMACFGIIH